MADSVGVERSEVFVTLRKTDEERLHLLLLGMDLSGQRVTGLTKAKGNENTRAIIKRCIHFK